MLMTSLNPTALLPLLMLLVALTKYDICKCFAQEMVDNIIKKETNVGLVIHMGDVSRCCFCNRPIHRIAVLSDISTVK